MLFWVITPKLYEVSNSFFTSVEATEKYHAILG